MPQESGRIAAWVSKPARRSLPGRIVSLYTAWGTPLAESKGGAVRGEPRDADPLRQSPRSDRARTRNALTDKGLCPIFSRSKEHEVAVRRMMVIIAGLLCVLSGTALFAADATDLNLSTIVALAQERQAGLATAPDGPAGVLAALAGTETLPVGCATPIVTAGVREPASSEALGQALASLLTPPLSAESPVFVTRDGRFALHYPAAGAQGRDREITSQAVARVAEALVAARSYVSATLGFTDPAPAEARVAVYLVRLGHGVEGFVVPTRAQDGGRTAPAFVVLDAALASDRIMPATLHQVAHLALMRTADTEIWWQEATASYVTLVGSGDLDAERQALGARLKSPGRGLMSDD